MPIISAKCKIEDDKIFKEEKSIKIFKNNWFHWKHIIALKIWLKKT